MAKFRSTSASSASTRSHIEIVVASWLEAFVANSIISFSVVLRRSIELARRTVEVSILWASVVVILVTSPAASVTSATTSTSTISTISAASVASISSSSSRNHLIIVDDISQVLLSSPWFSPRLWPFFLFLSLLSIIFLSFVPGVVSISALVPVVFYLFFQVWVV